MEWWVTKGARRPIGPVSTELLLQGIHAGMVPGDTLVCEVGGTAWKELGDVAAFSAAIDERRSSRRGDSSRVRIAIDPPSVDEFLTSFDDVVEHTATDRMCSRPWFESSEDATERTLVDVIPCWLSDPPTCP